MYNIGRGPESLGEAPNSMVKWGNTNNKSWKKQAAKPITKNIPTGKGKTKDKTTTTEHRGSA